MKYTRMKRLTYSILREHAGQKELVDIVLEGQIFNPMMNENTFWYLLENDHKIYEELYKEGKIKKPKGYGEWVRDLI